MQVKVKDYEEKQPVLLRVRSWHVDPGEPRVTRGQDIELMTEAYLENKGDLIALTYRDSEVTGFDGVLTCIVLNPRTDFASVTRMTRAREASDLTIEKNTEHFSNYQTPFGAIPVSLYGKEITVMTEGSSGEARLCYDLFTSGRYVSENTIELSWSPMKRQPESQEWETEDKADGSDTQSE